MTIIKRIFIVGHPGAGKALFAKTVAEKLGWNFVDIDLGLEFKLGRTLTEILGKEGEESFYGCEAELIEAQLAKENCVIATDVSIVCSKKIRELLASEFVVFLHASTPVQIDRTFRSAVPLLLDTDLETFLDALHQERDPLFEKIANIVINSDDNDFHAHIKTVTNIVAEQQEITKTMDALTIDKRDSVLFHKMTHIPVKLSEQQAVCLKLLAQGKSSKEIARDMDISYRTVEGTIAKTMEVSGCTSSKELIALYHAQP